MVIMEAEAKAQKIQNEIESQIRGIGKGKYGRVLKMTHRPNGDEYKKILTITAIGIALLGAVGFGIMWLMTYLPGYF